MNITLIGNQKIESFWYKNCKIECGQTKINKNVLLQAEEKYKYDI